MGQALPTIDRGAFSPQGYGHVSTSSLEDA